MSWRRAGWMLLVLSALFLAYQAAFYVWLSAHPLYSRELPEIQRHLQLRLAGLVVLAAVMAWLWRRK